MEPELDKLDLRVKAHYEHCGLADAAMRRILNQAEAHAGAELPPAAPPADRSPADGFPADESHVFGRIGHGAPQVGRRLAWAAVLLIGVSLGALAAQQWASAQATGQQLQSYAQQVAMAHHAQLPVEYQADFQVLCDKLDKLNFEPVVPAQLVDSGYKVVGVRYCHVGTTMAAQFRLACPAGKPVTLYQFVDTAGVLDDAGRTVNVQGTDVRFWREGGVVMAMAAGQPR